MEFDNSLAKFDRNPWLIETKFSPPLVSHDRLIQRHSALAELEKISCHQVCFLCAPAGYGKTCLLTDWRALELQKHRQVAWLSLDENDSEIRQFLSYIILSITSSGTSLQDLEFTAQQGLVDITHEVVVPRLLSLLNQSGEQLTLILDDYHLVSCDVIDATIKHLVTFAPENFKLILSCRTVPDFDFSKLFANGIAFDFPSEYLRFSREETHQAIGGFLEEAACDEIFEQTEGWAVAVQLARLANQNTSFNTSGCLQAHNEGHIISFFTRQILDQSTDEECDFLLNTSILDKFNADLAACLTSQPSTMSFIYQSKHIRSLLISIDTDNSWFRYHHLFSELLLQQLAIKKPEHLKVLHQKASKWYQKKGLLLEAVKHAKASGDIENAATMIMQAGGWELVLYSGIAFIRSLLRKFDRQDFDRFPRLRVAYAYSLIKDGKIKDAETQLELTHSANNDKAFQRDYYIVHLLLLIYKDEVISKQSVDELRSHLSSWDRNDFIGMGVLQAPLAVSEMALGHFNAAEQAALDSVKLMRKADSVIGVNYNYIHLGQCAFYQGDFKLALAHLNEASLMAGDNFGADSRLKTNCDINLSSLGFWQNPTAFDHEKLTQLLIRACKTDSWCDIYITGFTVLFESSRARNDPLLSHKLHQIYEAACLKRDINRLSKIGPAYGLLVALTNNTHKDIVLGIDSCLKRLQGIGCINDSGMWLVAFETVYALGIASLEKHQVLNFREHLDVVIRIAERLNAHFFLVRFFVLRGALQAECKHRQDGFLDIFRAARLAAQSGVKQPFCASRLISKHVRSVIRIGRESPEYRLEVSFLSECLATSASFEEQNTYTLLSTREYDVLQELAFGKSNKEIARALDMTDHTVKFHLKNIFRKLGVNNRIAVINASRQLDLI